MNNLENKQESFDLETNSKDEFVSQPIKRIKLESIIIDRGLDFIEEPDLSSEPVPSVKIYDEIVSWSQAHGVSAAQVFFPMDYINIKILKMDRPVLFLPFFEACLLGFNFFFAFGIFAGAAAWWFFPEIYAIKGALILIWLGISAAYGLSIGIRSYFRRKN